MYTLDNFLKYQFDGAGKYMIPAIFGTQKLSKDLKWVSYREKCRDPANYGLHFFIDDYRFDNLWRQPDRYIEHLQRYAVVLQPDFSMYTDMPKAMQIFNHYKKQWLAAYWQVCGIEVIPTISWSDQESFEFCFDGVPQNSIVAVSSVGCMKNTESKRNFINGYNVMMEKLRPHKVLFYGIPHTESKEIIKMGNTFTDKFDRR